MPPVKSFGSLGKWFLGLGMAVICWGAFLYARPAANFIGESSRIVFFHVPQAWVSTVAFFVAAWFSWRYLRKRRIEDDEAAAAAARLGFLFCRRPTRSSRSSPCRSSSSRFHACTIRCTRTP